MNLGSMTKQGVLGGLAIGLVACSAPAAATSQSSAPPSGAAAPRAAAAVDTGASTGSSQTLTKITVPYQVLSLSNMPFWGAYEAGIFQKHGLDVNMLYVDNPEVASLMSGSAEIAQGGGPEVVSADADGADVVFVASLVHVYSYIVEARPDI